MTWVMKCSLQYVNVILWHLEVNTIIQSNPLLQSLVLDPSLVPDVFSEDIYHPWITDWCNAQNNDPSISCVIVFVRRAVKLSFRETNLEHPDVKLLLREWKKLELRDDVLYRRWSDQGNLVYQLVLPEQFRERTCGSHVVVMMGAGKIYTTLYHPQETPWNGLTRLCLVC